MRNCTISLSDHRNNTSNRAPDRVRQRASTATELKRSLREFRTLATALLDSSSWIYMHRAGFLPIVADTVSLHTVPGAAAETGLASTHIRIEPCTCPDDGNVDRQVLERARRQGWPVISDDKEVLLAARKAGLPHFNALMMLHFLLFRRRISPSCHRMYFLRLQRIARYSQWVWTYAGRVLDAIVMPEKEPGDSSYTR